MLGTDRMATDGKVCLCYNMTCCHSRPPHSGGCFEFSHREKGIGIPEDQSGLCHGHSTATPHRVSGIQAQTGRPGDHRARIAGRPITPTPFRIPPSQRCTDCLGKKGGKSFGSFPCIASCESSCSPHGTQDALASEREARLEFETRMTRTRSIEQVSLCYTHS